ncbi:nuclear pore complex protein NUP50B-like [Magnolia sinica]|uniref:nuclear pore complex protein NUP50B-like n=1 Tax=Magnolia sinica TaxID=86752 RepID=UPI002658B76C|nr:nuclear pore complex protein NUP50B-like [Magnolia sinica]
MGDAENAVPSSKKRVAGRELSRDNPGLDDDAPEEETGTFQRASEDVLATRRIVKVRRTQPPSTTSSNPFAGIRLVPSTELAAKPTTTTTAPPQSDGDGDKATSEEVDSTATSEKNDVDKETKEGAALNEANGTDENAKKNETNGQLDGNVADKEKNLSGNEPTKAEEGDTKEENENEGKEDDTPVASAPLSSFQQLSSSQNAFTGLAGTGFSSSSFSFGSIPKDGSAFGLKNDNTSFPSFGIGSSNNGSSSLQLFGSSMGSDKTKSEGSSLPSMQEVPVETGEENEKAVFTADAILFEYLDGGWKERGKGELKVNISTAGAEKARLVMRARGNYRLILNASLYPDMKLTNMDKKGITFACVNSASGEGKHGLTTFALKFRDGSIADEFRGAVTAHKGKKDDGLKTPENSPKAHDD